MTVSYTPSGCKTFCKSLKLQELLDDKNYQMERLPKETLCTMILAALGSQEEGSRKARQVFVIQDVLGPLITDGYVGVCCKTLQKLCARVKDCMLRPSNGGRMRDTTYDARVLPYFEQYIRNPGVCAHITQP